MKNFLIIIIVIAGLGFAANHFGLLDQFLQPEKQADDTDDLFEEEQAEPSPMAKLYEEEPVQEPIIEQKPTPSYYEEFDDKPKPPPRRKRTPPPPEEELEDFVFDEPEEETFPMETEEELDEEELSIDALVEAPDAVSYANLSGDTCETISDSGLAQVSGISHISEAGTQKLTINFNPGSEIDYKVFRLRKRQGKPFRIFVDLKNSCVSNASKKISLASGSLISQIKPLQFSKTENSPFLSRIAIEFTRKPQYKVEKGDDTLTILLK